MNFIKSGTFLWKNVSGASNRLLKNRARTYASSGSLVSIEVDSKTGVSTVKMNRPPVNSLSLELVTELTNAMIEIEKNKGRGLILTSSSPGVFTAGIDIMELYQPNPDRVKAYWTGLQDMWLHLYSSGYPTVAAISGHAPGAGCLLACSCDYRIMVQGNYTIGLNETQLGLSVPSWFVDTFRNVVSKRQSELALVSGTLFPVENALKVELIDEIAENNDAAIQKATEFIAKLSKFNLAAMSNTKLIVRYDAIKRLQDSREQDLRIFTKFVSSPEVQKGLQMYLEALKKKK